MFNTAKHYSKNCDVSFPGALLKASLIPTELLDRYINMSSKILDLGCGEGMLSHSLARLFPVSEIYGIDLDDKKIQQGKACKLDNMTFQQGDAEQFSFKNADAIIFNDMLHHNVILPRLTQIFRWLRVFTRIQRKSSSHLNM